MKKVEKQFRSEAEQSAYIRACDAAFERKLERALKALCADTPPILLLSGPSCSCKTTTAHSLIRELEERGKRLAVISIDDFFRDRAQLDRRRTDETEELDYDSADALDLPCFAAFADRVCRGERAMLPKYDFHSGVRASEAEFDPAAYDVLLFEGIQAIYPEITRLFAPYPHRALTLTVSDRVTVNGIAFTGPEIRLFRRIVRDERYRSAPASFTLFLWESVRRNEEQNILPCQKQADVRLDSFLPYELFLLRDPLLRALSTIPADSRFAEVARTICDKIAPLPAIPERLLPQDSVYHEFL